MGISRCSGDIYSIGICNCCESNLFGFNRVFIRFIARFDWLTRLSFLGEDWYDKGGEP